MGVRRGTGVIVTRELTKFNAWPPPTIPFKLPGSVSESNLRQRRKKIEFTQTNLRSGDGKGWRQRVAEQVPRHPGQLRPSLTWST
jgi:hypothetical protein